VALQNGEWQISIACEGISATRLIRQRVTLPPPPLTSQTKSQPTVGARRQPTPNGGSPAQPAHHRARRELASQSAISSLYAAASRS
jgi:hypothetical protein